MSSENIYTVQDRTPFTYYIKWSTLGISYYGCRYKKGCKPSDLWSTYFTSSKYVKDFIYENGNPDIVKVTRIFNSVEECRNWEDKFLIKTNANKNPKLLNRANRGSYGTSIFKPTKHPVNIGPIGLTRKILESTESILDIKIESKKEKKFWVNFDHIIKIYLHSEEERKYFLQQNSLWRSGCTTPEQRKKLSDANIGKSKPPRSDVHRQNISKSTKGKSSKGSGPTGTYVYHNFVSEIRIPKNESPPNGFIRGRIPNKYGNKNFGSDMLNLKNPIK